MAIVEQKSETADGRRVLTLKNPATLEFLYDIECQTEDDVNAIVAKARAAQPAWAALTIAQRVDYMLKLRDLIIAKQDYILDVVIRETGKPMQDALMFEVYAVCAFISYWSGQAQKTLSTEVYRAPGLLGLMKKIHLEYKPLGVVGVIAPWNGPFVLTANPVIQAMIAGNTVVAKGSEVTPFCSYILQELCEEVGIPEGVCNVLIGDGLTGAALTASAVDKVSFTGSVNTGKKVGMACLETLTPFSLELGGNDAMIVLNDADLEKAAHGAVWGSCVNTGHYCCGTERIYVEEGIYDKFVARVTEITKALRQGQEHGVNEDIGAVFWDKQFDLMQSHVDDAVAKGAKVLAGGGKKVGSTGLYFEPTVLVDVDETSKMMVDETFGPILPIIKVKTGDEAVKKANESNFGLHGSIWTQDKVRGLALARQIHTGSMAVNDIGMMYGVANAPFGGVKNSGMGSVNGRNGLRGYTHAMPIILGDYRGADSGYPHDQKKHDQLKKLMNFLWKNPIGRFFFGP